MRHNLDSPNTEKIILTGASGFIGQHIFKQLMEHGCKISALTRDTESFGIKNAFRGSKIIHFDLSDQNEDLHKIVNFADATLLHCAWADVRHTSSLEHFESHLPNHYHFLKMALEAGVKKIIVTGSCYEYGLTYGPVSPRDPTFPSTFYGFAKDSLHKSLRLLQSKYKFDLLWARIFYVYGDGQDDASIIPQFDAALMRGDESFNMSLGEQLFDYLPVETVANKIIGLINRSNGIFNICSGDPISLRRLLEDRMNLLGCQIKLNLGHYEYRKSDSIAIWGSKQTDFEFISG